MTTDTQLAPTDAEIKDLYAEQTGFILDDSPAALLDFARAVLARWGQPAHSGEPYGCVTTHRGTGQQFFYRYPAPPYLDNASECVTVYTAPQPVEREALTDERIRSMCAQPWVFDTVKQWVRITEAAHGIKAGRARLEQPCA